MITSHLVIVSICLTSCILLLPLQLFKQSTHKCLDYLLRGDLMHIRSVVRCAARRERKIVMLFQLQHLLMGRRTLNDWDFQLPLSDHLKNSSGPNYTPPPDTVRRKEGTTYRLCRHGDCCPKLAVSPYNEWNWYCASHFYLNFEGRILRYELEVAHGFEERGLELFHNLPIKLNDKQTTYRPDFHRHGSNRVEIIELTVLIIWGSSTPSGILYETNVYLSVKS